VGAPESNGDSTQPSRRRFQLFNIDNIEAEGLVSFGSGSGSRAASRNTSRRGAAKGSRTGTVNRARAAHEAAGGNRGRGARARRTALQELEAAAGNRRTTPRQLAAARRAFRAALG
jgi:hypothetical protein